MTDPTDQFERLAAALAERYALERELGGGGLGPVHRPRGPQHAPLGAVHALQPDPPASPRA